MEKQEAAELLRDMTMKLNFINPELAEAMKMGAQALQKDDLYHWVEGDLKDWLEPPYLDEVNLGC